MNSELFTFFLPFTLAFMMMGLGLNLRLVDFYRIKQHPKVIFISLFSQLVILVGIAFLICKFFELPPAFSIGLMLLAASPGGPTSNAMTYLFKGDIALNMTLTATHSVLSIFTLPFIINLSLMYFLQASSPLDMPALQITRVFLITLLPVSIGMLISYYFPQQAKYLNRPMRIVFTASLFCIFFIALYLERHHLREYFFEVGHAVILFCFCSVFIGFFVPYLFNISIKQALTCSFECTIHNTALAITIALSVLESTSMAVPAGMYSIFMFIFASLFGLFISRRTGQLFSKHETQSNSLS